MDALKCLKRTAMLATLPGLLALAGCGGAAGGAALPAPADPPDGGLVAEPAIGTAPMGTTLTHEFDDPQPQTANYQWEWDTDGDGDMDMITSGPGGPVLNLNFAQPGNFKVKLKVTGRDADGNNYTLEHEITIVVS